MGRSALNVAVLSTGSLVDLSDEIEQTLRVVFKISTSRATERLERTLSAAITKAWKSSANAVLDSKLASLVFRRPSKTNVTDLLKQFGLKLSSPLTPQQVTYLGGKLRMVWRHAKRIGAAEAKGKFSFSLKDARAVAASNKQQVFWVNTFYNQQLSKRIVAVSRDIIIESGLSQHEAGVALRKALGRELGIRPGGVTQWAAHVPARYAGNVDLYFRQVAATAAHQCRTFGKLTAFQEAGVAVFRLTNPNDERTGKICFGAGAPVLMADLSTRPIEEVRRGDVVVTGTGIGVVEEAGQTGRSVDWLSLRSFAGRCIITPEHELFTTRGWEAAKNVKGQHVRTSEDLHVLQELRRGGVVLPEQSPTTAVLLSCLLQGVATQGALVPSCVQRVRQEVRGTSCRGGERLLGILLDGLQEASRAKGCGRSRVVDRVQGVRQEVQEKTVGGPFREAAGVLLSCLQTAESEAQVRDVRGAVQDCQRLIALLLAELLQEERSRNSSRTCYQGVLGAVASTIPRGSSAWEILDRLPGVWGVGAGDRRRILAWQEASRVPKGEAQIAERARVDLAADWGGGIKEGTEYRACIEDNLRFGWGSIELTAAQRLDLPTYNLKIAGDDPTYVVSGVLVHNCQQMHGQEFTVQTGVDKMNEILGAKDPADVKSIAPWLSGDKIKQELGGAKPGSPKATAALENAKVILPPFHSLCRTEPVMVSGSRIKPTAPAPKPVAPKPKPKPPAIPQPARLLVDSKSVKSSSGEAVPLDGPMVENHDVRFRQEILGGKEHMVVRFKVTPQASREVEEALMKSGGARKRWSPHREGKIKDGQVAKDGRLGEMQFGAIRADISGAQVRMVTDPGALKNFVEIRIAGADRRKAFEAYSKVVDKMGIRGGAAMPDEPFIKMLQQARMITQWDDIAWRELGQLKRLTPEAVEKIFKGAVARNPKLKAIAADMKPMQVGRGHVAQYSKAQADYFKKEVGIDHVYHDLYSPSVIPDILADPNGSGLLSSAERFSRGIFKKGQSTGDDFATGGADSVFVRLSKTAPRGHTRARVVIDPDQLGRSDWYFFNSDKYGAAGPNQYAQRTLAPKMKGLKLAGGNEAMLQHSVPTKAIKRIIISDPWRRKRMIEKLRKQGITKVNGKKIEDFITVK